VLLMRKVTAASN